MTQMTVQTKSGSFKVSVVYTQDTELISVCTEVYTNTVKPPIGLTILLYEASEKTLEAALLNISIQLDEAVLKKEIIPHWTKDGYKHPRER